MPDGTTILTQEEVRRLLSMPACIEQMAEALATLAREQAYNPLRWAMRLPDEPGLIGLMPGSVKSPRMLGLKIVTVFPQNHGTEYDSHQGLVVLFEPERGLPLAIMDASEVTAIRTAAVSGLATRLLAREDAGDLAILGSGVQARTHLEAMLAVRPIRRVRVFSPTVANREAFARKESERHDLAVEAVDSAEAAVRDADLICTVTSSHQPVLEGSWVADGAHINAAGASIPTARELDTAAVVRSRLFVDRRESTLNEAGDFLIPRQEGAISDDHIVAEIGELLIGRDPERDPGRRDSTEITLFKSLGLAVEDLFAARHVWQAALEQGVGTRVALGGKK